MNEEDMMLAEMALNGTNGVNPQDLMAAAEAAAGKERTRSRSKDRRKRSRSRSKDRKKRSRY